MTQPRSAGELPQDFDELLQRLDQWAEEGEKYSFAADAAKAIRELRTDAARMFVKQELAEARASVAEPVGFVQAEKELEQAIDEADATVASEILGGNVVKENFARGERTGLRKAMEILNTHFAAPVAAEGRAEPGMRLDGWLLQDSRSYVGNDMLFWATGGGYTTDVSKAEVFTEADAMKQHRIRDTDLPWPKAYIVGKTRPAVDFQYVDRAEAKAAAKGRAL